MNRVAILLSLLVCVALGCGEPPPVAIGDPCQTTANCGGAVDLSCLNGTCQRLECERTASCPLDTACIAGICGPAECAEDADCDSGSCFEGDCRDDLCASAADCEEGLACFGTPPTCRTARTVCQDASVCVAGLDCKLPEGRCEPPCDSDASCEAGEYCDGTFCRRACSSSRECAGEQACVDGRCVGSECPTRACPAALPYHHPISCECVECLSDGDCDAASGRRCDDSGLCVFCVARSDDPAQCEGQGLVFSEGCCVECTVDAECASGGACERGRCITRSTDECTRDEECGSRGFCDAGRCTVRGSRSACSVQSDCPAGEACYADGLCRQEAEVCQTCPAPSRCVADAQDTAGTCAGCQEHCATEGCADGQVCYRDPQAPEGFCVEAAFAPECR